MASLHSIPRLLLARHPLVRAPRFPPRIPTPPPTRHVSTPRQLSAEFERRRAAAASTRQKVMPQPDAYRPPSHGKTVKRAGPGLAKLYGPKLTDEDRRRMAEKKYPNMMSPEGTFSHWFLNNRAIHVWITMGVLISLGVAAWYMDFMSKTIYADLLPDRRDFWRHPIQSSRRFFEVYKMHVHQTSQECYQQRLKKGEDLEKRREYRRERQRMAEEKGEEYVEDTRYYVGEDGVRRRRVKRWFGIWE